MLKRLRVIFAGIVITGCVSIPEKDMDIPLSQAAKVRAVGMQLDTLEQEWHQTIYLYPGATCQMVLKREQGFLAALGKEEGIKSLKMPAATKQQLYYREYLVPAGKSLRANISGSKEQYYCKGFSVTFIPKVGGMYELSLKEVVGYKNGLQEFLGSQSGICHPTVMELHANGQRTPVQFEVCKDDK